MRKKFTIIGFLIVFVILLVCKILLSGFYLTSVDTSVANVKLALADENPLPEGSSSEPPRSKAIELKAREEFLKKREAQLEKLKREVEDRMAELNELQTSLTVMARKLAEKEQAMREAKMGHLVALYSAMDPAKAAEIMDKLKIETVVLILRNMKGKNAGKIVAMMNTEKSAEISEILSHSD